MSTCTNNDDDGDHFNDDDDDADHFNDDDDDDQDPHMFWLSGW